MKPPAKIATFTPTENVIMNPEDILTPEQLAERLKVKVSWVYEKNRRRAADNSEPIPVLNLGRYLRFYWPDICAWLRNRDNPRRRAHR